MEGPVQQVQGVDVDGVLAALGGVAPAQDGR
jgi:hypothetical protein